METPMLPDLETINNRIHMDRLVNRRDRIMTRIRTIDDQLKQLERNALLYDQKGEQQRNLLSYLANFHHTEVDQVDSALNRIAAGKYGACIACSSPIEADWLESFPEAEFCSTCYRIRERTAAA
jgi:RNA polymerase-binding transcription factor DksA